MDDQNGHKHFLASQALCGRTRQLLPEVESKSPSFESELARHLALVNRK